MNYTQSSIRIEKLYEYLHYHHSGNYVFEGHRHSYAEINVLLRGKMEITCGDMVLEASAGDIVLIKPDILHQNRVLSQDGAEMIVVSLDLNYKAAPEIFTVLHMNEEIYGLFKFFIKEAEYNRELDMEFSIKNLSKNAEKLLDIFLNLLPRYSSAGKIKSDQTTEIYELAIDYMNMHIAETLTISEISRHCGVCKTTLKNVFAYYTGKGAIKLFSELKLQKALHLLKSGRSCCEVSRLLGYSSQAYFSKCFKDEFGVRPSKIK